MDDEDIATLVGIAHDLRTPLTRIALAIELLRKDSRAALLDSMQRNLKNMEVLIVQFLDYARTGAIETAERVDLNRLVQECAECHTSDGQPLRLSLQELPQALLRAQSIRRAIDNLIVNARRYGGAEVLIETRQLDGMARVSVMDRGPGIPVGEIEMLKKPFTRGSQSMRVAGTGLGLAIVEGVARAHGGRFVLSPREGGGLEAHIHLPLGSNSVTA
jgi:two-component system, OmpR family, osmolarity sensor histidine kinase EnvZ